jgi:hypothetical protein
VQCPEREFLLRISYLEIYNEVINDLLAPQNINLKIREESRRVSSTPLFFFLLLFLVSQL